MQKQEEDTAPTELLQKPKEYFVKFSFPEPPPLQPPILGLHSKFSNINFVLVFLFSRKIKNLTLEAHNKFFKVRNRDVGQFQFNTALLIVNVTK